MSISKKQSDRLYAVVHEEIIQARIKIAIILNESQEGKSVEGIMSRLNFDAPEKAIGLFKTSTPPTNNKI